MDADFLQELDTAISYVGTEECWKRQIGGRVLWFSPIPAIAQAKIDETIANVNNASDIIFESKKLALANSIVGIDEIDLRSYRFAGEIFNGGFDPRVNKEVKVNLPTYLMKKINNWGAEFLHSAFKVFADLIESHERKNLENVKFENNKSPMDELIELELKTAEIRRRLGMPQMVEARTDEPDGAEQSEQPKQEKQEKQELAPLADSQDQPAYDPFETVGKSHDYQKRQEESPKLTVAQVLASQQSVPQARVVQPQQTEAVHQPVVTVPIPVVPSEMVPNNRFKKNQNPNMGRESSLENPFKATPSVTNDILENPIQKRVVDPPVINSRANSINPRFRPSK